MKKIIIILFFLFPSYVYSDDQLKNQKIFCEKFLWGFNFISEEKVNVITTDYNKKTNVKEYFYKFSDSLPYINIYEFMYSRNPSFSINIKTLRVDIWTMTSGGYTSREIISANSCKKLEIDNLEIYIESLK